jgi:hypothetical protein
VVGSKGYVVDLAALLVVGAVKDALEKVDDLAFCGNGLCQVIASGVALVFKVGAARAVLVHEHVCVLDARDEIDLGAVEEVRHLGHAVVTQGALGLYHLLDFGDIERHHTILKVVGNILVVTCVVVGQQVSC